MNICLDDLEIGKYKIYQDRDAFCFGIDSVLLANFAIRESNINIYNENRLLNICDLCSGNIPIPLIMYAKRKIDLKIDCYEIEKDSCELAKKSILYNLNNEEGPCEKNILNDINIVNMDLKNILQNKNDYKKYFDYYDVITCNPPYIKIGSGIVNDDMKKYVARHEVKIKFDEICKIAYLFLKSKKSFYLVHRTNRLAEIIFVLKKNHLEPKTIQFVHSKKDTNSSICLIEARKDVGEETIVRSPIIIYNNDMNYTDEVLKIYGK